MKMENIPEKSVDCCVVMKRTMCRTRANPKCRQWLYVGGSSARVQVNKSELVEIWRRGDSRRKSLVIKMNGYGEFYGDVRWWLCVCSKHASGTELSPACVARNMFSHTHTHNAPHKHDEIMIAKSTECRSIGDLSLYFFFLSALMIAVGNNCPSCERTSCLINVSKYHSVASFAMRNCLLDQQARARARTQQAWLPVRRKMRCSFLVSLLRPRVLLNIWSRSVCLSTRCFSLHDILLLIFWLLLACAVKPIDREFDIINWCCFRFVFDFVFCCWSTLSDWVQKNTHKYHVFVSFLISMIASEESLVSEPTKNKTKKPRRRETRFSRCFPSIHRHSSFVSYRRT